MATNDWITTQEAATLSGYHFEHIRRLLRQGKLKGELKGTMYWISKSFLLKYLREAEKSHTSDKRHGPKNR